MLICEDRFVPLSPAILPELLDFQERYPDRSCERAPANLFLYQDSYDWHFRRVQGALCTVSYRSGHRLFPAGEPLPAAVLLKLLEEFPGKPGFYDCEERLYAARPDLQEAFTFQPEEDEFDYLYSLERLAAMEGAKLRKRRNLVRQFERACPDAKAAPLTAAELPELIALAEELDHAQEVQDESLQEEYLALRRLEECWRIPELRLGGMTLRVAGKLVGLAVYSPVGMRCADVHFEKATREFPGAGAATTWLLARQLLQEGYAGMNREQDLGDEGLRHAKRALDPSDFVRRGLLLPRTAAASLA